MNQSELISTIAERAGFTQSDVRLMLDTLSMVSREQLVAGGDIKLSFGKLSVAVRRTGPGRNPVTGETITIPERRRVKFTTGKAFRDALNPAKPAVLPVARRRA